MSRVSFPAVFAMISSVLASLAIAPSSMAFDGLDGRWQRLDASYEVPAPKEFAPYANITVRDLRIRSFRGVLQLKYTIPQELTGTEVRIEVVSNDQGRTFKGPLANFDCGATLKDCAGVYPNLKVDKAAVKAFLESNGVSGAELEARLKVVDFFIGKESADVVPEVLGFFGGSDPHGVLHIKNQ